MGILVGTLAVTAICVASGYTPASPACAAIAFASSFQVSISVQKSSMRISGGIVNHGRLYDVGYDVPE
ncbi:MAG: hypothetical protein QXK88_09925 [Desulfurococcaceae archaeon]